MNRYVINPPPRLGTPAIVAMALAISSYVLSFSGHGVWGLIAALCGMICGVIGVFWAVLPGIKGAFLSLIAIVLGAIALVPAILSMLGKLAAHL